jgi:hypothetical protein
VRAFGVCEHAEMLGEGIRFFDGFAVNDVFGGGVAGKHAVLLLVKMSSVNE